MSARPLHVAVFGATSGIAHEAARAWARQGASFFLAGRSEEKVGTIADDLRVRGAVSVATCAADLADVATHAAVMERLLADGRPVDRALVAWGTLPDQQVCEQDSNALARQFTVNATSVLALANRLVALLERQGHGSLAVIGSVAGDRGRRSNYAYGAAKAAVDVFMTGVRARLRGTGASAILVKPGFVRTPMTAHLPPSPLFWSAEAVGRRIVQAMEGGSRTVYTPFFWQLIMGGIRALPEPVMQRLRF
jgi:short-subunit dehydrogenase